LGYLLEKIREKNGKKVLDSKSKTASKIQSQTKKPVRHLWQVKGIYQKIWNLPDLLQNQGGIRPIAWRYQVKLVVKTHLFNNIPINK
jgi:hypothetical protein